MTLGKPSRIRRQRWSLLDATLSGVGLAMRRAGWSERLIGETLFDIGAQGALIPPAREDVTLFAAEQKAKGFKNTIATRFGTLDGEHGRVETRKYPMIHDVSWLQERHGWPGLAGALMVESTRELPGKTERETRFYVATLALLATIVGPMIRD